MIRTCPLESCGREVVGRPNRKYCCKEHKQYAGRARQYAREKAARRVQSAGRACPACASPLPDDGRFAYCSANCAAVMRNVRRKVA